MIRVASEVQMAGKKIKSVYAMDGVNVADFMNTSAEEHE